MATLTNSICTTNKEIDILSGSGAIKIGTDAAASTITIGNGTGATSIIMNCGTGALNIGTNTIARTITIGNTTGASAVIINSGSGNVSINPTGNTAISTTSGNINIGGASSTGTVTISSNSSSGMSIFAGGSCPITIQSNNSMSLIGQGGIDLESSTGSISLGSNAVSGAINIGNGAASRVVTIGNITSTTALVLNSGTNGYVNTTTNGVFTVATGTGTVTISGDATNNTINIARGAGVKLLTLGSTNTTSSVTINTGSGGINIPSFTTNGVLISNTSGVVTDLVAGTATYVLTSNGTGSPVSWQAVPSVAFTWNDQTTATVTIVANNGYIMDDGATLITATLPTTAALGAEFKIVGKAAGLWTVAQNASQSIVFGSSTTTVGTGGSLSSTLASDCISVVCTTANTVFTVFNSIGNLTVV